MPKYGDDYLLLRKKRIPLQLMELPQADLNFYLENPRLYSVVRMDGREPTQEEIEETLVEMEHVKQLVQSIRENGGLMDAIIVQAGKNTVLEGNSRLAAYRILASKDPVTWGKIKAKVLPEEIDESDIFSLLGQYHIIGKKDWAPYEQAGYLYRRHKVHGVTLFDLAKEIDLKKNTINHLIEVYQFMLDKKEKSVDRWSYYDEYLKSNKIGKARKEYPEMDDLVVKKIKSGEIERAVDIRDGLKKVCEAGGAVLSKFVLGKRTFEGSVESALDKGVGELGVSRLKKFREWLGTVEAGTEMVALQGGPRKQCVYELEKINKLVDRSLKKLGKT